jgi:Nuclease-related domain
VARRSKDAESIDRGTAGASARRRYEQLRESRERRVRRRFGRLGGVVLAVSGEPQSIAAWERGSRGERRLGKYLDSLDDGRATIVLHDRRVPGTNANIDHIAITRSGRIWVIDAKQYAGEVRRVGGGLRVGSRDCTPLVRATGKQVDAVRAALGDALAAEFGVVVQPALCFVDAERALFARPFEVDGVWICWRRALGRRLRAKGAIEPAQLLVLARRLVLALPSA